VAGCTTSQFAIRNSLFQTQENNNVHINRYKAAQYRLLTEQLLAWTFRQSHRSLARALPDRFGSINSYVIQASVLDLSDARLAEGGERMGRSCRLGHNLNLFWPPVGLSPMQRRLCAAIKANAKRTKFVLMNTVGNRNRDLHEPISFAQQCGGLPACCHPCRQ
jgi:hypothetical protein